MKALRWFGILILLSAPSLWPADELFDLKQVVPGVYAAIAKEQYKVNCNAAVILLDDTVLVVDTHSKPSAARALQAQIKTVTDKPVKFVVNTHFHWDHYQGNQAYLDTWPKDVQIISSQATRENIEKMRYPACEARDCQQPPRKLRNSRLTSPKPLTRNRKPQFRRTFARRKITSKN